MSRNLKMLGTALMALLSMTAAACVSGTATAIHRNDEDSSLDTVGRTDSESPASESITGGTNTTHINESVTANERINGNTHRCNQLKVGNEVSQRDMSLS